MSDKQQLIRSQPAQTWLPGMRSESTVRRERMRHEIRWLFFRSTLAIVGVLGVYLGLLEYCFGLF